MEWLAAEPGSGCGVLSLSLAWKAITRGRPAIVVVDREKWFYPPAMLGWETGPAETGPAAKQIDLRDLIVVRPGSLADELWALDQALRCPAVAAVWSWLPRLSPKDFRRLQLAAEQGGALGMLMRPATVRGQPSWSDIQLLVEPAHRAEVAGQARDSTESPRTVPKSPAHQHTAYRWKITCLRCRTGASGANANIEMLATSGLLRPWQSPTTDNRCSHETHPLSLVSQLAHPKGRRRQSRA